jgi:hypothetical protein
MTQEHRIAPLPPPELVDKWNNLPLSPQEIIVIAWQHGADQELEACCALMDDWGLDGEDLMLCRRPKPPSLKEQALEALAHILSNSSTQLGADTIRRAIEQLPDEQ